MHLIFIYFLVLFIYSSTYLFSKKKNLPVISDLILLLLLSLLLLSYELILRFFSYMPVLIFSIIFFPNWHDFYLFSIIRFLICSSFFHLFIYFAWEFENSQECNKKVAKLSGVRRELYQRN